MRRRSRVMSPLRPRRSVLGLAPPFLAMWMASAAVGHCHCQRSLAALGHRCVKHSVGAERHCSQQRGCRRDRVPDSEGSPRKRGTGSRSFLSMRRVGRKTERALVFREAGATADGVRRGESDRSFRQGESKDRGKSVVSLWSCWLFGR